MRALILALSLLPLAALAETAPMTGAEFEAYATGKTLTYAERGEVFGTEEYLPGRRVRWAFTGEQCRIGHWYEQDQAICFVYEDLTEPQCWEFRHGPSGMTARFLGESGTELSEVAQSDTPLACAGPDIGV